MMWRRPEPVGDVEQLVDLLLVLGKHDRDVARDEKMRDLLVERVAIEAEAHGADGVRGDLAATQSGRLSPISATTSWLASPSSTSPSAKSRTRA